MTKKLSLEELEAGEHDWSKITKEDMIFLTYEQCVPDSIIAKMYGVTKNQVTYKRTKKFGIKLGTGEEWYKHCIKKHLYMV